LHNRDYHLAVTSTSWVIVFLQEEIVLNEKHNQMSLVKSNNQHTRRWTKKEDKRIS
jgi:hypothetical protein